MRRSRSSNVSIADKPVTIDVPNERDRTIFSILSYHRFLPSNWLLHHFPTARRSVGTFLNRLGHLREEQNGYLRWSDWPLNVPSVTGRHGVYELATKGHQYLGITMPRLSRHELPHELIVSLHECSLKFQARAAGIEFFVFDPLEYKLPSGKTWRPDGHPMLIGDTLFHSEIERRKYNESPKDTEEKIEKVFEYMALRMYQADAKSGLTLFLSSTEGRTNTLMRYVKERHAKCPFIGFATTRDWVQEPRYPDPAIPLVSQWERVGYPPLNLFGESK